MNELKTTYRRLLNRYHPDRTQDPRQKSACTSVTIAIVDAYEREDLETLTLIEAQGIDYRPPVRDDRSSRVQPVPYEAPVWSAETTTERSLGKIIGEVTGCLLFPFTLAVLIGRWNSNGRLVNAASVVGAVLWLWLLSSLNDGISRLAHWGQIAAFGSGSIVTLLVLLVHTVIIAVALPIVVPLGVVAFRAGFLLFGAWLLSWIGSHLLALLHPWLGNGFSILVAIGICLHFWDALDDTDC